MYSVENPIYVVHSSLNNLQEFEKIPLFMKKAPSEIDPQENPDLACLQSIIFDEERSPEGIFSDFNICFASPLNWDKVWVRKLLMDNKK